MPTECEVSVEPNDIDWLAHRRRVLLDPEVAYLNTGSYSPLPGPVLERSQTLRQELARSPSHFHWRRTPGLLDAARSRLAEFLHVSPADLVLLPNVTTAINLVLRSLRLPPGSEVVLTDLEYGAMRLCLEELASVRGWQVRTAPIPASPQDPEEIEDAVRRTLSQRTRLVFFSHVTSPTGLVLPAEALCRLARQRGALVLVDGAHAPGMFELDLGRIGADYYAGNCHKWLMAPSGAGFLHVRPEHKAALRPLITSWGWGYEPAQGDRDSGWGASFWARNLEFHGTGDRIAQMVLPEVLDFRDSVGPGAMLRRARWLAAMARERLAAAGYQPATPAAAELSGSMTAFEFPPLDVFRAREWLFAQHRIEAPFTTAAGRCFLRVSTAWFNLPDEIERLVQAVRALPLAELR